jgi:hypothetical protein
MLSPYLSASHPIFFFRTLQPAMDVSSSCRRCPGTRRWPISSQARINNIPPGAASHSNSLRPCSRNGVLAGDVGITLRVTDFTLSRID